MTQPKDVFSIRPAEVEQARLMLGSMVKDLRDRFPAMKKEVSAQAHPAAPAQPNAPASDYFESKPWSRSDSGYDTLDSRQSWANDQGNFQYLDRDPRLFDETSLPQQLYRKTYPR